VTDDPQPGVQQQEAHTMESLGETRYYLELAVKDLRPGRTPRKPLVLRQLARDEGALAGWLYRTVGAAWQWIDRAAWTDGQWRAHLASDEIEMWLAMDDDERAGYFEVRHESRDRSEIITFGLLPTHVGRGLGGHLLCLAVGTVAASGARVVWLHTCSRDHPNALANYQARGFVVTRTEPFT
jgi:ribosomal protein S18 acetylase RimI-like enzyme